MSLEDNSSPSAGTYKFTVCSTDPSRPAFSFACMPTTSDMHKEWVDSIKSLLQRQHDFLKQIQNPILYHQQNK